MGITESKWNLKLTLGMKRYLLNWVPGQGRAARLQHRAVVRHPDVVCRRRRGHQERHVGALHQSLSREESLFGGGTHNVPLHQPLRQPQ